MGTIDFAPLFRSTVGFDRLFDLLDGAARFEAADDYPPYNIEKTGEDAYRITMAVAGFEPDELSITTQPNLLVVAGQKAKQDNVQYLHHGLATRAFEHRFDLADYVRVKDANLENGLLSVDLVRELPEAMKPRKIQIGQAQQPKAIEAKAADSQPEETKKAA
ncbi:molecular chaperone IbpA [Azospirillum lipoferum]|uniref:Hsp20 family protein n=1 Tax=Azospirillum lipoferum TaxID=193 RepID=A0A5A9G2B9_AZOLI|nr:MULTISPECIES: Hsp20 family protein [Azospirillum]KAA0588407.1 Hsp20 family protein [Azospirillum lipoferum]MCP1615284.1 molecular chaperone IbpA [Azospirillum lipoferum]MDW5534028.1 Hsp20 family protein [Azospirillum sp. NL1]